MTLADLADYTARHGAPDDETQVTILLGDASSLVRRTARVHISEVADEEVVLDGDGSRRLLLPNVPVIDVDSVVVAGVTLVEGDDWRWWSWGGLDRRGGKVWPAEPRAVTVTYSHGSEPVPDWIVNLVCAMVQRALVPQAASRVQSQTTGSQTVQYAVSSVGVTLWLTEKETARLESLRGPAFA